MPKKRPIEERFWEKVDKLGEDECWIWLGATIQPGGGRHVKPQIYGKIAGPRTPAGRVFGLLILSWILKHGDIRMACSLTISVITLYVSIPLTSGS
jgi:hypothetical protein